MKNNKKTMKDYIKNAKRRQKVEKGIKAIKGQLKHVKRTTKL